MRKSIPAICSHTTTSIKITARYHFNGALSRLYRICVSTRFYTHLPCLRAHKLVMLPGNALISHRITCSCSAVFPAVFSGAVTMCQPLCNIFHIPLTPSSISYGRRPARDRLAHTRALQFIPHKRSYTSTSQANREYRTTHISQLQFPLTLRVQCPVST